MELNPLLERLKMPHLAERLDTVCEQVAKRELGYPEFLSEALGAEWQGRHLKVWSRASPGRPAPTAGTSAGSRKKR